MVGIDGFGDSSIDLSIRFWGPTKKLFALRYEACARLLTLGGSGARRPR